MVVEDYVLELLPKLLRHIDSSKKGWCIDIGVGTAKFYFKTMAVSGYKTLAVEPLPIAQVRELAMALPHTVLEQACVWHTDGEVPIYTGVFQEKELLDVSSIHQDWWGVSKDSKQKMVPAMTLIHLLEKHQIKSVTYLKVDTEGSEYEILTQLSKLSEALHPAVVEFEYGGGGTKQQGVGGWEDKYFASTLQIMRELFELGYRHLSIFERENDTYVQKYLANTQSLESIFEAHFVYGNILMHKAAIDIATIQSPSVFQRMLNKINSRK
ncbi:FkbM family methyltransferase [Eisenibacter elegans]|jgi:FkbM family methyltransferase|uniref:FkbM family methyltransferase n=1 Tax=Eisenibacter elegans TaxID=997 RepID=UPI0004071E04|nr:FkbM family methyltransferase [Eisenibacter elegans]